MLRIAPFKSDAEHVILGERTAERHLVEVARHPPLTFAGVVVEGLGPDERRRLDAAVRGFHERRHSFSVPTKAYIVLIAFQTLYQFSAITTMKSDSDLQYPQ